MLEKYYSVEVNKAGKFCVMCFVNIVVDNIETADLANDIANSLTDAYEEGKRYMEEQVKSRLNRLLFDAQ
jgi:hypothetical protein